MIEKIKEVSKIITNKVSSSKISLENYISTENMIYNFGGITIATSIPSGPINSFEENDILLSNIRPYFRKTWFSNMQGGCSTDIIVLRANTEYILPKYLFYIFNTDHFVKYYVSSCKGTKMPRGNKDALIDYKINLPDIETQQHIVDTIGSVDDLIENYQGQLNKLKQFGIEYINFLNDRKELIKLSDIAKFEKGFEVGSINYISKDSENYVRYLRVGDLISQSNPMFISKENAANMAHEFDILIAFDGAPGRTAFGLKGAFSSGIYKINSDFINKGLVYFELISKMNQKTINDHSQGTTILHASKSIPFLQCIDCHKDFFNDIFKRMVYLKQAINILEMQKKFLLDKYFTNQL